MFKMGCDRVKTVTLTLGLIKCSYQMLWQSQYTYCDAFFLHRSLIFAPSWQPCLNCCYKCTICTLFSNKLTVLFYSIWDCIFWELSVSGEKPSHFIRRPSWKRLSRLFDRTHQILQSCSPSLSPIKSDNNCIINVSKRSNHDKLRFSDRTSQRACAVELPRTFTAAPFLIDAVRNRHLFSRLYCYLMCFWIVLLTKHCRNILFQLWKISDPRYFLQRMPFLIPHSPDFIPVMAPRWIRSMIGFLFWRRGLFR